MTNHRFTGLCALWLCALLTAAAAEPPPGAPDERDRQVLASVLLHLLADKTLGVPGGSANATSIVLHTCTPGKTGFLMPHQIKAEIGSRTLPSDAAEDLQVRNTPADRKPDTYDSVNASYAKLTFPAEIVVADLAEQLKIRAYRSFENAYPKARAWVMAYLPGYSKDGMLAVIRAQIGPTPHGAMLTAVVEKSDGKWIVKWHHIAFFA